MRKIGIVAIALLINNVLSAQSDMTLYNMETLPQRMSINPARTPDCNWYFGTPGIGSVDFEFASNALAFAELDESLELNTRGKFTLNLKTLTEQLDDGVYIGTGANIELLAFGFRVKKSMFTFALNERVKSRIDVPEGIIRLTSQGNGGANLGSNLDFGFGLQIQHTREIALGYSRSLLDDRLTVGGRLKYVIGLNTINTTRNELLFNTNPNTFQYDVTADIEINASTPLLADSLSEQELAEALLGSPQNSGFGIDLGISYKLTEKLELSASAVDLGMITWRKNVTNIRSQNPGATFSYRGVDIFDIVGDSVDPGAGFQALGDTLIDVFALDTTNESFTTGLQGEVYIGANYHITDRHNAGILLYGSFFNGRLLPGATVSWNSKLGRVLALSGSYTVGRGNFANIGFGSSLNLGPEQLYLVSDNLIEALTGNVKTLNIRFGWNHTFGRKKYEEEKRKKVDK